MIKLILLDFDGTLADSKSLTYRVIKEEVEKAGEFLSKDFEKKLGTSPLIVLLQKEKLVVDVEHLARKIVSRLLLKASEYKLTKDISSLKGIKAKKVIISNNSKEIIEEVLKKFSIYFINEVHGYDESYSSKAEKIKEILNLKKISPKEAIYVGDRETDVSAAKKAGCYSVAISNKISWAPKRMLLKSNPDFLIKNLKELNSLIIKLNSS